MTLISKFTRRLLFILALTFATLAVANAAESTDATVARQFALLEIIGPEALSVRNEGGAAQLFGAMGAIAQNTLNASNGEALTKLSQDLLPQLAKEFAAAFLASAAKAKISVAYLADQPNPPEIRGQKVLYDKVVTEADYILQLKIVVAGYRSSLGESDYSPFTLVRVWVTDSKTKERVFTKVASFGWDTKVTLALVIPGSLGVKYPTFADVLADIPGATSGILKAVIRVAEELPARLPL